MCIPHFCLLFIVDGHLVFFYLLVIVNTSAMNMGVQLSPQDLGFNYFGYVTRNSSSILIFWEIDILFPTTLIAFHNPINCAQTSSFSTLSQTFVLVLVFHSSHPDGCEIISPGGWFAFI